MNLENHLSTVKQSFIEMPQDRHTHNDPGLALESRAGSVCTLL